MRGSLNLVLMKVKHRNCGLRDSELHTGGETKIRLGSDSKFRPTKNKNFYLIGDFLFGRGREKTRLENYFIFFFLFIYHAVVAPGRTEVFNSRTIIFIDLKTT